MSAAAQAAARASLAHDAALRSDSPLDGRVIHLDLAYRLPALCGDEANERHLAHDDLGDLGDAELAAEAARVSLALAFGDLQRHPWARSWFAERLQLCQAEARERGRA
jgi:hypothetical protein